MWAKVRVAVWLTFAISGCSNDAGPGGGQMDSRLQPYMTAPGVAPAGERALMVYLYSADGRVIEPASVAQVETRNRVRLLVRVGPVPLAYTTVAPDDRTVDEGGGFTRAFPQGKAYQAGILRFTSPGGCKVYSWQTGGATVGNGDGASEAGNYLGQIEIGDDMSLEYLYYARSQLDHKRIAGFVEHWYDLASKPPR